MTTAVTQESEGPLSPMVAVSTAIPLQGQQDTILFLTLECGHHAIRPRKRRRLGFKSVEDPWPKRVRCEECPKVRRESQLARKP